MPKRTQQKNGDSSSNGDDDENAHESVPGGHSVNAVHQGYEIVNAGRSYLAVATAGVQHVNAASVSAVAAAAVKPLKRLIRPGEVKSSPAAAAASSSAASRRVDHVIEKGSKPFVPKSLDVALRTTARVIDSGATVSITPNKDSLMNVRRCSTMPIIMADGTVVSAVYKGDMPMRLQVAGEDKRVNITVRDVYFHERIHMNLLSWDCMRKDGWSLHSGPRGTHLITPKGTKLNASTRGGLTILDDAGPERVLAARMGRIVCQSAEDMLLLHNRIGHASWGRLVKMCRTGATHGVGDISGMSTAELKKAEELITQCDACICGKQTRDSIGHGGLDKGSEVGEVLHMDTFYVVMRNPTTNEKYHEYCLLGTDPFCNLRWASKAVSLHDIQSLVIQMIRDSTSATGRAPRLVVCDLGSEFNNKKVQSFCTEKGIHLQMTPARAKELNGVSEKSVDTVKNHMRAMLLASGMPEQQGWWRAVAHHVYLWNRTHIGVNTGVTPYEATLKRVPNITNVGVFGCDAFVHQDRSQRDTTCSPKAKPGIYLGHDYAQNCAIVYMLDSGKRLHVKDVYFREDSFKNLHANTANQSKNVMPLSFGRVNSDVTITPHESQPESQPESDHDVSNEKYEVASITGQRGRGANREYQVNWSGYSESTWEPEATMREDAPDAVDEYEESIKPAMRVTRSHSSSTVAAAIGDRDDDDEEESRSSMVLAARSVAAKCL